jgi:polysaccharide export outer membrane protein
MPSRVSPLLRRLAALALVVLPLSGCNSPPKGPTLIEITPEINATRLADTFVITPGDTIALNSSKDTDLAQELTVLPDGTASFSAIGTLRIGGFTPEQVRQQVQQAYREARATEFPEALTVTIVATAPRSVTVMGEVNTPGPIAFGLDQRMTLVEAIGKAGSFSTNTAWLSSTLLVRWDPATQTQRHWVIDARPEHWVGREPLLLQSFDVIYIPNTKIDRVGIWVDNFIRRLLPFPFLFPAPA